MPKPKCKLNIRFPVIRKEICGFKFRLRFRFLITPLPLLFTPTPSVVLSEEKGAPEDEINLIDLVYIFHSH